MKFEIKSVPEGFRYDYAGLVYFEVKKDGSVTILDYSASSMRHPHEHSCVAAYSRASIGESTLYVCCHKNSYDLTIYRIAELEAFADGLGIIRKNTHVHDIVWEYSERQPESKRYAQIKVSFRCGCKVGIKNARTITRELNEQYGLFVLLNSFPSFSTSEPELRVERNSLQESSEKNSVRFLDDCKC